MSGSPNITSVAGKVAYEIFVPTYMKHIYTALSGSQKDVKDAETKGLAPLEEEARKQQILMEFQEHQARVTQELAIDERIAASHDVVIEEYYEGSAKGQAGLTADSTAITFGGNGEGRRVTKRVIRFSGWNDNSAPPAGP